jgi:hypothetical protein
MKFEITIARGPDEVFREGFDRLPEAQRVFELALGRYLDCEMRLTQGGTALMSSAPAPAGSHR